MSAWAGLVHATMLRLKHQAKVMGQVVTKKSSHGGTEMVFAVGLGTWMDVPYQRMNRPGVALETRRP